MAWAKICSQDCSKTAESFFHFLLKRTKCPRKEDRGFSALYAEKLELTSSSKGDSKELFVIGPLDDEASKLNQWPSKELLPNRRPTMKTYYRQILSAGKSLLSLVALALNLDEKFFDNVAVRVSPVAFLRLLHYPGASSYSYEEILGASAHSDYGMITLLATDGVPGLQVCREKDLEPRIWENVPHIDGALIVNIGDMTERWTNCLFRQHSS